MYLFQGSMEWVVIGAKIGNFVLKFLHSLYITIHSSHTIVRLRAVCCSNPLLGLEGGKEQVRHFSTDVCGVKKEIIK